MKSSLCSTARAKPVGVPALLCALLLVALSALLGASPAAGASHQVSMQQYAYGPSSLSITQGDTVTWTNKDEAPHDVVVTSGPQSFRSPLLDKGESWSFTFGTVGSYSYTCSVHPDMRASVTVAGRPAPTPAAPPPPAEEPAAPASGAHPSHQAPVGSAAPTAPVRAQARGKAPQAAAAPVPAVDAQVAPTATTTLDPLLLVAGTAIAVVVFCLLLLASRPRVQPVARDDED